MPAKKPRRETFKAYYQGATPEQVAEALHRYRPERPDTPTKVAKAPTR